MVPRIVSHEQRWVLDVDVALFVDVCKRMAITDASLSFYLFLFSIHLHNL